MVPNVTTNYQDKTVVRSRDFIPFIRPKWRGIKPSARINGYGSNDLFDKTTALSTIHKTRMMKNSIINFQLPPNAETLSAIISPTFIFWLIVEFIFSVMNSFSLILLTTSFSNYGPPSLQSYYKTCSCSHPEQIDKICTIYAGIGLELGLSGDCIHGFHLAATIHDLEKIVNPAEILVKPAKLSSIEYEWVKEQVDIGIRILRNVVFT
jgi:hypothetical protein